MALKRLGREEVVRHTLDDHIEIFFGLVSFHFCLPLEDAKRLSCQEILQHDTNLWPSLESMVLDYFMKSCLQLDPRL